METILFLAHTENDGTLSRAAREALGAAVMLRDGLPGASLSVGLWGAEAQPAADAIAGCGATSFRAVTGTEFASPRYASDAAAATALVRAAGAGVVIAATSSRAARALPGVALRVGGRIDTHVTGVEIADATPRIRRWYYRQRMVATMTRSHRPWMLLVDAGVFAPWEGAAGTTGLAAVEAGLATASLRTRTVGEVASESGPQTIRPDADLLFVAGAGWTKPQADGRTRSKEAETLILDFIGRSRASLGGSKSLVEQGSEGEAVLSFMTHMNQVGQTGSTPRHPKGLSTCCHGEEPHVVGWRFIGERRAVNKDPNCGWARGKADVVYVADAFEVMAKVNGLLAEG